MDQQAAPFEGWALVEQMGHKSVAGYVREQLVAGVPLLRIDVPGPDGSTEPIATQFIHASTLYALTPMAEAMVRKVAARTQVQPAATWGMGALPAGRGDDDRVDFDDIDDEGDPMKVLDDLITDHGGLSGVLALLIENHKDVAEPESDRYTAILEHAKELVDTADAWPMREAPASAEPRDEVQGNEIEVPPPAPAPAGASMASDIEF